MNKYKSLVFSLALLPSSMLLAEAPTATVGEGWRLVWNDEFSGSEIDESKWNWESNCWGGGNNELQCYTDRAENSFIRDGHLVIKAQPETFEGPAEPLPPGHDGSGVETRELPYTSARLRTLGQGDWKFGRIEVRAKVPYGQGIWPAIWMLPTDWVYGGWAASGEIDIMEAVNLKPGEAMEIHGTLHYGREWPNNVYSGASFEFEDSDPTQEFHTYAIEWTSDEIRWYVDEHHYATQRAGGWYAQAVDDEGELYNVGGSAPFDQRFHLLLNVAVGGNWPGNPDDSTAFPVEMEVDYVRVFDCPESPLRLSSCQTKNRRAQRVFGHQPPEIIKVEYDENIMQADEVVLFAEEALPPFSWGQYVANGTVTQSLVNDGEFGLVEQIFYGTNESVAYLQGPVGFDISAFTAIEFDLKLISDPRTSGGLVYKMDCFYPCGTGDYPLEMPEVGEWTHYRLELADLLKHGGSSLDLTNVNTPLVIFPDWGNQQGVSLAVDNVRLTK